VLETVINILFFGPEQQRKPLLVNNGAVIGVGLTTEIIVNCYGVGIYLGMYNRNNKLNVLYGVVRVIATDIYYSEVINA